MPEPVLERSLENFGFAQVLVTLKQEPAAARKVAKAVGKQLLDHFLNRGSVLGQSAVAAVTKKLAAKLEAPAARFFPRLGVAVGYVDAAGLSQLAASQAVEKVDPAEGISLIRPVEVKAARATRARLAWGLKRLGVEALWKQGLKGEGVRVGHLDTGVDGKHKALKKQLAAFQEFDFEGNRIVTNANDTGSHGTHTAGTICGGKLDGTSVGVAPAASLYSGLVIEGGNALMRVLGGMEWLLEQEVRVLSLSLGFRGYTPFFLAVVQRLREQGVLPVFAIGNEGAGSSRSPGNYPQALSVGATDPDDAVADFSSSIRFNRTDEPDQPNVVAPGVDILSAAPGGGGQLMSGTSMATPHVAGVAALLLQAKPEATVAEIETAIQSTCTPLPGELPQRFGFGMINPKQALKALR